MGKSSVLNYIKTIDIDKLKIDLSSHSRKYIIKNYNINKHEYYFLLEYFNIKSKNIKQINITNGIINDTIDENESIPEGFHIGKIVNFTTTSGYVWYHNGIDRIYLKSGEKPPEGYIKGTGIYSNKNYKLYNDGTKNFYIKEEEEIPKNYNKGILNKNNYIKAANNKKKYYYTNGINEIKLTKFDIIPKGYYLGRLKKLSFIEKIKKRDEYYKSLGYIAVKDLSRKQLSAYQYLRDNSDLIKDIIHKDNLYTYINKKYLKLLNDYCSINHSKGTSKLENNVYNYIKDIYKGEIITNCKKILKDKNKNYYEIDIYIPDKKIGIEFNGIYWHSNLRLDKEYHLRKSLLAEKNGIRLIHIYEHEWLDDNKRQILKSMLKIALGLVDLKIYARNCIIKEITNQEAKPFNEKNHLQGHRNAQITYGLFYNNELVQLMSFSKTKYNKNLKEENSWEIIRGCPGSNNIVVGGVSKLFKHFIKEKNPSQIFSYCDFNKFDGKGYEAIGMKFIGYTGPNKWWILKNKTVVERQPKKYKELKEASQAIIWGSGSKKYLYENKKKGDNNE